MRVGALWSCAAACAAALGCGSSTSPTQNAKGFLELGGQEKGGFRTVYDIDGVTYAFQPGGWRALPESAQAPAWEYERGCAPTHAKVVAQRDSTGSMEFRLGEFTYRDLDVLDEAQGPDGPLVTRVVRLNEALVTP